MISAEVQTMLLFILGFIAAMVSIIPECIIITTYHDFNDMPIALKIYTIIHLIVIIAVVLYLNWIRPSEIYLGM